MMYFCRWKPGVLKQPPLFQRYNDIRYNRQIVRKIIHTHRKLLCQNKKISCVQVSRPTIPFCPDSNFFLTFRSNISLTFRSNISPNIITKSYNFIIMLGRPEDRYCIEPINRPRVKIRNKKNKNKVLLYLTVNMKFWCKSWYFSIKI